MSRHIVISGICCFLLVPFGIRPAASSEKVLYRFHGGADGRGPEAQLIKGNNGALYGTTYYGGGGTGCNDGDRGCGTVFELTLQRTETVLYAFNGGSDGAYPLSNLVMDGSGNLYGTTEEGGLGSGTVFKLAPDGTETVLYAFQGAPDGWAPEGNLVADSSGNLYGTTYYGGGTGGNECGEGGCGTVFKVTPDGTETVLHAFQGGNDGYAPSGGVILDNQGNLYGTTLEGGGGTGCSGFGCGTVFEVAANGTETVHHVFEGGNDGIAPWDSPILDGRGNLYGTTVEGGAQNLGTVFKLAPDGTETVLHAFSNASDGLYPLGGLIADTAGNLFGTTSDGGDDDCHHGGCGTVFELTSGGKEKVLYVFQNSRGRHPAARLLLGDHDKLYGTAPDGGKGNNGVVFAVKK